MDREEFYKLVDRNLVQEYKHMVGKTIGTVACVEDEGYVVLKFSDGTFACLYGSGDYEEEHTRRARIEAGAYGWVQVEVDGKLLDLCPAFEKRE